MVGIVDLLQERGMESVLLPAQAAGSLAMGKLEQDLHTLDWAMLDRQLQSLKEPSVALSEDIQAPTLLPGSTFPCPEVEEATARGWDALKQGRVAICTVAGGQASRLGFDAPKGSFPLGPTTGSSLFHMFAGQVSRLRELSSATLPWIVQTGPGNHEATQDYFRRRDYFGLGAKSMHFVCQNTLPTLTPDGQFLLSRPDALFRNPDGHGGFYKALEKANLFDRLRKQGIDLLFYCQVDNPMITMGDPAFLGFHLLEQAQMSVKVIEKKSPEEKMGVIAVVDGKIACVEYSDISPELSERRSDSGGLFLRAGNIAVHAFDLDFAERMAGANLPLHLANKEVSALVGNRHHELRPCVKFESFVFDALPLATKAMVQDGLQEDEFAALKSRVGANSIQSTRLALSQRARRWLKETNPELKLPSQGFIEFAPGLALDARDLRSRKDRLILGSSGFLITERS